MQELMKKKICILLALLLLASVSACGLRSEETVVPEKIDQGSIADTVPRETPPPPPAETAAQPVTTPTPEPTPEPFTDEYFADAAFFGNSLVDGLRSFGGLEYGDFFAGTSASVLSVDTIKDAHLSDGTAATLLDALLEKQYGKIYILLGINELGFNKDSFVSLYADLLDTIAAAEPDAVLYIMSLTPLTEKRSNSDDLFTRPRVEEFNAAIRTMAETHGYIYLDLYSALADANGWLPQEQSTDGVHFTVDKYWEWADFLRACG